MEKKYLVVVRANNNVNTQEVVASFDTRKKAEKLIKEVEKKQEMFSAMSEQLASHFSILSHHIIEQGKEEK